MFKHIVYIISSFLLTIIPVLYLLREIAQHHKPKIGVVGNTTDFGLDAAQVGILVLFSLFGLVNLVVSIILFKKQIQEK